MAKSHLLGKPSAANDDKLKDKKVGVDFTSSLDIIAKIFHHNGVEYFLFGSGSYMVHGVNFSLQDQPHDMDFAVKNMLRAIQVFDAIAKMKGCKLMELPESSAEVRKYKFKYEELPPVIIELFFMEEFGMHTVMKSKVKVKDIFVQNIPESLRSILLRTKFKGGIRPKDIYAFVQLIKNNPEVVTATFSPKNDTLLHIAVDLNCDIELIQILVEAGSPLDAKNIIGSGKTPLDYAKPDTDVYNYLHTIHEAGFSPDHLKNAINRGDVRAVNTILARNPELITTIFSGGYSPLHLAIHRRDKSLIDLLVKLTPNLDVKDEKGQTPLHIAATMGLLDVVDLLLVSGASFAVEDSSGKTPGQYVSDREKHLFSSN